MTMVGLTKADIERDAKGRTTKLKLEILLAETNAPLRKRHEMAAIGAVLLLAGDDPGLAEYIATKAKLDPDKYLAMLALIGCTREEVEADDEEAGKDKFRNAIQGNGGDPMSPNDVRASMGMPKLAPLVSRHNAVAGSQSGRGGPCPKCGGMDIIDASQSLDCNGCGHSW